MQHDTFLYLWSTCSYRLYSFLNVRDVAHLDSAFSNHSTRKQFHTCLSRSSFVGLLFHGESKEWIIKRNLAPVGLLLEHNITDHEVIKLTESCGAVERLSVGPLLAALSSTVLTKLLQHSPKLKIFELNGCDKVDSLVYRTLAEKCQNLTELIVQTEDIDTAAMRTLFCSCPELKKIHITELKNSLHDSVVSIIGDHCSGLTI